MCVHFITYLLRMGELKGFLIWRISVKVVSRKDCSKKTIEKKKVMNGRALKAELE